jgi:hypothetical protein
MYFLAFLVPVHPIHISVTEIEFTDTEIVWTSRIYTDDLLLAVYGKNTTAVPDLEPEEINKDILQYLSANVTLILDKNKISWTLVDVQPDPEAIWITMSAMNSISNPNSLQIGNRILADVYRDQKNIVNLTIRDKKKNLVFESKDKIRSIVL